MRAPSGRDSNGLLQFAGALSSYRLKSHSGSLSAKLGIFKATAVTGIFGIRERRDLCRLRQRFFDEFQPRAKKIGGHSRHTCDVAAREHKALNQPSLDEISGARYYDGDRVRGFLGGNGYARATDHNHIRLLLD